MTCVALALGLSATGCYDANASTPPPAAPFEHAQAETTVAVLDDPSAEGGGRALVGYIDFTDSFCRAVFNPLPNQIGLSESTDLGASWTKVAVPEPDSDCISDPTATGLCVTRIRADPWLATDGDRGIFVALAETVPQPRPADFATCAQGQLNAIVVSERSGGAPFGQWQVLSWDPDPSADYDKVSVDARGGMAAAAWLRSTGNGRSVRLATRDPTSETWVELDLDPSPSATTHNPIVKVVSDRLMYLFQSPGFAKVDPVRVTRLTRGGPGDPWNTHVVLDLDGILTEGGWPAEGDYPSFGDAVPHAFDVAAGNASAPHLWVAFAVDTKPLLEHGGQVVLVVDCIDEGAETCGEGRWRQRQFTPPVTAFDDESYLQPNIIASQDGSDVRVTWYRYFRDAVEVQPEGVISSNGGTTWSGPFALTSGIGARLQGAPVDLRYTPCTHNDALAFFGDYFQSEFLPVSTLGYQFALSAFSDSRGGCGNAGEQDLHIQAAVW